MTGDILTVLIAMLGGAIRVSTPFMFVALGECLTEKSGRVNLGLEGTLVLGAMVGYAASYHSGNPWVGVFAAGLAGSALGAMHGSICGLPRVNDVAVGIAMMLFGVGVAFFFGKPYIQPTAPRLSSISLGFWSDSASLKSALQVNPLFFIGFVLAASWPGPSATRAGASSCARSATAPRLRAPWAFLSIWCGFLTTTVGGFLAGIGGAFLSLSYPGSWNQGLSSGQGLMAVALVIFARWDPHALHRRSASVRRGGRPWALAAIDRGHRGLLFLQRRPLYPHARHHDRDLERQALGARHARRIVDGEISGRRIPKTKGGAMNGLGGLNKSPNGVVVGVVQLQLPIVVTPADLAAQTQKIVATVGKARRNMATMDLVVFPEYSLHGLSMDMNPAIMCSLEGPEIAAFKQACRDNSIWGCFSIMEFNPHGNPYNSGVIIDDIRSAPALLSQDASLDPGRALGAGRHRHSRLRRAEGREARAHHLPRRHVSRDGARMCLQGRGNHDPHGRLHGADPRRLALHQPGQQLPEPDGHRQCLHVRLGRRLRLHGRRA